MGPGSRSSSSSACSSRWRHQRHNARGHVAMRLSNNRNDEAPVGDRVLSALPYLLPVADGINYSKCVRY